MEKKKLEQDCIYRIVIIGYDYECGVKSILKRFTCGVYSPFPESEIGVDFDIKIIKVDNEEIKLQIWPHNRYLKETSDKRDFLYRGAHGFLLVYGCHSQKSYDDLFKDWIIQIDKFSNEFSRKNLVLVCNNAETPETCNTNPTDMVDPNMAKQWAHSNNIPFFIVDPKQNINIDEPFIELARIIKNHYFINGSK
ncbi:hypothetical protein ACTA71_006655 [Dictyostelium dimigraforme]